MKAVVRPLESKDLPGVAKLRILVYPHQPEARYTDWHDSVWRWLESHPLAGEMHRWVVADGDRIVGHLAAMPQFYRINGERVVAHTPADYQVLPQYGFQALSLMRRFFRTCENCVACDMVPAVIAVETRLGAEEAGGLHYAAKLLNVSRLPVPPVPAPIKRLLNVQEDAAAPARGYENGSDAESLDLQEEEPPPIRPRAPIPVPVRKLLNRGLRMLDEALGRSFGDSFEMEELEGFDESFDELFEAAAAVVPCLPEKDAAFLRWRYGPDSPQAPVTVLGVRSEEGLLGYAVLRIVRNGEDGYILDLTTLPGRRDVARALLREAVRRFRQAGVHIIRYRFLKSATSPGSDDLWRLGFFFRNHRRNMLLVKFADRGLHKMANDADNWSYSVGDGEATFWVR